MSSHLVYQMGNSSTKPGGAYQGRGHNDSTLKKTISDLSEVTTVHGLRYALSCTSHLVDRLLWAVIVIGAFSLSLYMSVQIYLNWQASPVVTTIGTNALPITDLDFPAITLCR